MSKQSSSVAKVRVLVQNGDSRSLLMSRKKAHGKAKHGKLEFLGGHLDGDESPHAALLRELREEEQTGNLAELAESGNPTFNSLPVDRCMHHLFEMTITEAMYASLLAAPEESLGFELVPEDDLASGCIENRLTCRTREILHIFGTAIHGHT